jgi:hypothetical protein
VLPATREKDDKLVAAPDKNGARPAPRPPDWKAVEDFLALLARAVQQLHTYPPTSPLCINAIESCHRGLTLLEGRDGIAFRVAPDELIVDDIATGRGTQVGHELARRLHKAWVASVIIEASATTRELARFCGDLVRCGHDARDVTLLEMLTEHGIDSITLEMASRPEVLDVGVTPLSRVADVARERPRFDAQLAKGGVVNHLYPPQKGWVRLDPSVGLAAISLLDLAILADDPATLAHMLLRLTDETSDDATPQAALEKKYSDVAMLLSALEPRLARRMFARLAHAVLALEPQARQALLRRTILPGLLEGRVDGAILRDFPDIDLAESLCLLLDIETAAPELLTTALTRLELPEARHAAMVPLLEDRLRDREAATGAGDGHQSTLAKHARELVRVNAAAGKNFAEFAAFDLSLDEEARAALGHIRTAAPATDILLDRLTCLWHLTRLEPNPDAVRRYLGRSFALLEQLEREGRDGELTTWLLRHRNLADSVSETRPDVADVIAATLTAFCTPERAAWIAELSLREAGGRDAANAVIEALGTAIAAPLVELLEKGGFRGQGSAVREGSGAREGSGVREGSGGKDGSAVSQGPESSARTRAVAELLAHHAVVLAPALVPILGCGTPVVRRTLVRIIGLAGAGYEPALASQIDGDEQTGREALRSLARIGTPQAGTIVVAEIAKQRGVLSAAAEETLWRFPADVAARYVCALLGRREFTLRHPAAAERLLDRAARSNAAGLEPVLLGLAPLRFRIWSPAVARVARKAHAMLKQSARAERGSGAPRASAPGAVPPPPAALRRSADALRAKAGETLPFKG